MNTIRDDILRKINSSIPENVKPADYIMDALKISKVSAYRRLNGSVPFSYDEVVVLARNLNFSVDELILTGSKRKYIMEFGDYFDQDVQTIIFKSLEEYLNQMSINMNMDKVTNIEVMNNLWVVYTLFSDHLFKFNYYKYLQQYHIPSSKKRMKDIVVPDFIMDIKSKIRDVIINSHNCTTTSIIDRHIFYNAMIEIQYYYRRGLLEETDLKLIANDLKELLGNLERGLIEDLNYGRRYQYYVGQKNIFSNSSLTQSDNRIYSFFYHQNMHPIVCYDRQLCILHENYLQSQKRQSILISGSNEEFQFRFFEKQYKYLLALEEDRDLDLG